MSSGEHQATARVAIPTGGLAVETYTTEQQFGSLRDEWNELLEISRANSVYLTWEWLHQWWRFIGRERELRLVVVRDDDGRLVGLGPFCVYREPGPLPIRVLTFLGTTRVSSEYLDILAHPAREMEIASRVLDTVCRDAAPWHKILLSDLLESSLALEAAQRLDASRLLVFRERAQICPYLDLPASYQDYLQSIGSKTRKMLRQYTRKLEREGAELKLVETPQDLAPALDALFALHGQRWSMRGLDGNLGDQPIRAFHGSLAREFLDRGQLRLYRLQKDGQPIATLYGFSYGGTFSYYQSGMHTEWARLSPGFVLIGRCIEDAIAQGSTRFDFLRGPEPYKFRWTKTSRPTFNLTVVPRSSWKGIGRFRAGRAIKLAKKLAKKLLRREDEY